MDTTSTPQSRNNQVLDTLKHASVYYSEAATRYDNALNARNNAIRAAFDAGVRSGDIAAITGLTRQRLSTIRNKKN